MMKYFLVALISLLLLGRWQYNEYLAMHDEIAYLATSIVKSLGENKRFRFLGEFKDCPDNDINEIEISINYPRTANLLMECEYESGIVRIEIDFKKNRVGWETERLNVYSKN